MQKTCNLFVIYIVNCPFFSSCANICWFYPQLKSKTAADTVLMLLEAFQVETIDETQVVFTFQMC